MRTGMRVVAATLCAATLSAHATDTLSPQQTRQPLSVADVARQAVIGDPMSLTWNDVANQVSVVSPDGEYVAVVVRRGNPEQGTNDAELLVYRMAELLDQPQAQVVAKMSSTSNYQPIALVRWLADNQTLVFAGTRASEPSQVYQTDLRTGSVKQLTDLRSQLQWYDITAAGDWLATVSEPAVARARESDPECLQRGCLVTAETLYGALHGVSETSGPVTLHNLQKGTNQTFAPPEASDPDLVGCYNQLKGGLSPGGRFALRLCRFRQHRWPAWWGDYTTFPELKKVLTQGANGYVRQWVLYDFVRGTTVRLTAAPHFVENYHNAAPFWIDGGRRFILVGALEPLDHVNAHERQRRVSHYAVLMIDPATREVQRLAELDSRVLKVTAASWDQHAQTLVVRSVNAEGNTLPPAVYRRDGRRWTDISEGIAAASDQENARAVSRPRLLITQSLNDRPVLVAEDARTGATREVLDPDPWLAERALGRVSTTSWKSKDGREWKGGIYYPTNYMPGVRYPVLLQTHGFEDNTFSLSGSARNFIAQPLTGLGILVLQIQENTRFALAEEEWRAAQAGYESAIDHLDALGLIDRNRVGIQGWSRTGAYMGYTLTQSPYNFAAGVFTITADFGWWWYLTQGGRFGESSYGVPPFGDGLDVWQRMSPSFNLQRVSTPMLMCGDGVIGLWDWYVGLRRLGKPVEYWSFPGATHDVFKIKERMSMNQLTVDWFRYWLKGEEDSSSGKKEQYLRWRELRQQQEPSRINDRSVTSAR